MKLKPTIVSATIGVLSLLFLFPASHASNTIGAGSNLLEVDPSATVFFGENFEGVPLNVFDFGGTVGLQNVGPTDIIIRRPDEVTPGGPGSSATIPTVVDAFQLRSVNEVSIMGGPLGFYFITLSSGRGGPVSTGTMTINEGPEGDPHGTFSSSFDLFVDVRLNSLDGPILASQQIQIPDSGANPWRHEPTGPIQIDGVNTHLNGVNSDSDFWIIGTVFKQAQNGGIGARNAGTAVPELGSTFPLLSIIFVGMNWMKRRSR